MLELTIHVIHMHLYPSKQPIGVRRRGGKGRECDLMTLNRHFMEHGATPCLSWLYPQVVAGFNSYKMTMNLGSEVKNL